MSIEPSDCIRFDRLSDRNHHVLVNTGQSREEGISFLMAMELDGGFDGMLPDPIFEADLVDRLELLDAANLDDRRLSFHGADDQQKTTLSPVQPAVFSTQTASISLASVDPVT
jgi:hypothetical protein